jgi:hypothetical protein
MERTIREFLAASGDADWTTELLLTNATLSGQPLRIDMNREFLARALKLGFRELQLTSTTAPLHLERTHASVVAKYEFALIQ